MLAGWLRMHRALKYEEERCQYLSKEVRTMTMARDDWVQHVQPADLTNGTCASQFYVRCCVFLCVLVRTCDKLTICRSVAGP